MKLTFLGSGGGRFSAISQRRMTGEFRIDNLAGKNYHVDPGPRALIRTYQFGLDPRNINGVFVSHAHTDHYNDAEILIEAITKGMTKRTGTIVGSPSVLGGYQKWGPCISKYHQSMSDKLILKPDEVNKLDEFTINVLKHAMETLQVLAFKLIIKDLKYLIHQILLILMNYLIIIKVRIF